MVSDFAKASRNLQVLAPGAFFVAGARRGQPYGFRFCESFPQFAVFGLARCILCGRRRTRLIFRGRRCTRAQIVRLETREK